MGHLFGFKTQTLNAILKLYLMYAFSSIFQIFSFIISNISTDQMLYTEKDLEKSMAKIETIHFHQVCISSLQ